MKNNMLTLAVLFLAFGAGLAQASDVNIGVSVSGEVAPGVYGRIDIGNARPPVLYQQPVTIIRQAQYVNAAPIYMHVPPGHAKKWSKHCHKYNACGRPVYFVRSAEYGEQEGHKGKKHKHKHDD